MQTLRLIDFEVEVSDGVSVRRDTDVHCNKVYVLNGAASREVRAAIESEGDHAGYRVERLDDATYLSRGSQHITLFARSTQLTVTVDDPEALPLATVTSTGLAIGRFEFEVPNLRIVPERERHMPGSNHWIAEWQCFDIDAPSLSTRLLRTLEREGLRSGGTLAPKGASIGDTWHSEASTPSVLVKIRATQRAGHVSLRLEVVEAEVGSA